MNSANDLKLMQHKTYHDTLKVYVQQLLHKYSLLSSPFDPIRYVVGRGSDRDILKRAATNVLFKNIGKHVGKRSMWVLKNSGKSIDELAKMLQEEELRLRIMVWRKNDWGKPTELCGCKKLQPRKEVRLITPQPRKELRFITVSEIPPNENCAPTSFIKEKFFETYMEPLRCYVPDKTKRAELLNAIFEFGQEMEVDGWCAGNKQRYESDTDFLVKIYQNMELALSHLEERIGKR